MAGSSLEGSSCNLPSLPGRWNPGTAQRLPETSGSSRLPGNCLGTGQVVTRAERPLVDSWTSHLES